LEEDNNFIACESRELEKYCFLRS